MDRMRSRHEHDGPELYSAYRNRIRKEMIISEVRSRVRRRITVFAAKLTRWQNRLAQNDAPAPS